MRGEYQLGTLCKSCWTRADRGSGVDIFCGGETVRAYNRIAEGFSSSSVLSYTVTDSGCVTCINPTNRPVFGVITTKFCYNKCYFPGLNTALEWELEPTTPLAMASQCWMILHLVILQIVRGFKATGGLMITELATPSRSRCSSYIRYSSEWISLGQTFTGGL